MKTNWQSDDDLAKWIPVVIKALKTTNYMCSLGVGLGRISVLVEQKDGTEKLDAEERLSKIDGLPPYVVDWF